MVPSPNETLEAMGGAGVGRWRKCPDLHPSRGLWEWARQIARVAVVALALLAPALRGQTADEPQYLSFQVFQGGPDPSIPFDGALVYTPKAKIAAVVRDIVATIGTRGGGRTRLAFNVGPIGFDHTDAEARQIIADGFDIALAEDVAVGFHLDDAMFWSRRTDLIGDPANVEWTDFAGTPSTGLRLDWAHPPARMCFNAPRIRAEVIRRARDVIGAEIAAHVARLRALGREHLFAGVIAGWESHLGQDAATQSFSGFHALANRGYGPGNPPVDVAAEAASLVAEFIGLWTSGLAQAGIEPARIYTHVAFLSRATFATQPVPPGTTYELLVNLLPSTQQPSVAFMAGARPGFSTYPAPGVFDQIQEGLARFGQAAWASCEGTNLRPPGPAGNSGLTMEGYLARCFRRGATLVNLYSWGIGGPGVRETDPFRLVTEGPAALAAYRKFLRGEALEEPARLINVSTRLRAGAGDEVPIAGFALRDGPKRVALRVLGPSLAEAQVPDVLANPTLELVRASDQATLLRHDDWREDPRTADALIAARLVPGSAFESATVQTLLPGNYTVIARGLAGGTGNCLVEIYDLETGLTPRLTNLSTRGAVGLGDNAMIAGFVVGSGTPRRFLVRSLGPSLTALGVPHALADPRLEVLPGAGAAALGANDDWPSAQAAEISATGFAPPDPREAALILTLGPGSYSVIVRGTAGAVGNAIVEVYELP